MKKSVILIIQARMGSTRLPGKSMMDLAGAPLVGRILERVKRCTRLDDIVLAIPDTDKDTVTLATRGVATIMFISSTVCVITGNVT